MTEKHSQTLAGRIRAFLLQHPYSLLALAAALVSYALMWGSLQGFVDAIDHCDKLFCDFEAQYYPMGKVIFTEKQPVLGYFYSAFSAIVLSVFSLFGKTAALWLWGAGQLAAAYALLVLPLRHVFKLSDRGKAWYLLLFLTSLPLLHNFKWGQVSVAITLMVIGAFTAYRQDKPLLSAVLLAVATSIKYYPAIFILVFVFKRDYRYLRNFTLAVGVCMALAAGLLGPANWLRFDLHVIEFTITKIWTSFNSQHFVAVVDRLAKTFLGRQISDVRLAQLGQLSLLVAAMNIALAYFFVRKSKGPQRDYLAMMALFLTIPFIIKTSWPHYFVFLPFGQTLLLLYARSEIQHKSIRYLVYGLTAVSVALVNSYIFKLFPDWQIYSELGPFFFANLFLLAGIYLLVVHRFLPVLPHVSGKQ